jgi:hypothetical protein
MSIKNDSNVNSARRPGLLDLIVVDEWTKNRAGDVIKVELSTYKGTNFIALRTWFTDPASGEVRPGKGFVAHVRHLPRLAEATSAAFDRARQLGWLPNDTGGNK